MENTNPLVSVIIPVFNGEKTIARAVDSVLRQDYENIQILVINDCSTDRTLEILNELKDSRLQIITHKKNVERSAARNTGIKNARGDYIAFLDCDDEWLENKLSCQLTYLAGKDPSVWKAATSYYYYLSRYHWIQNKASAIDCTMENLLSMKMSIGAGSTLLIRTEVFKEIGLFNESLSINEDVECILRYLRRYKLDVVPQPLVRVYGHGSVMSTDKLVNTKVYLLKEFEADIQGFKPEIRKYIYARQWLQVARHYSSAGKVKESWRYLMMSLSYKLLFSQLTKIFPHESYFIIVLNSVRFLFSKNIRGKL